ncbi:MAG: hypothetical protein Q7U04_07065 [Bacteriovorax sp.]|nr:hypothetical protein [Bacteriovorax sp.]
MRKIIILSSILFVFCNLATAGVEIYQSTDNTGLNKQERIEAVEKYLIDLSNSIKKMESGMDDNSKKLKTLEDVVKTIKDNQDKLMIGSLGEKKPDLRDQTDKNTIEIDKLKTDIISIKNKDIEKLSIEFQVLLDAVKELQIKIRK